MKIGACIIVPVLFLLACWGFLSCKDTTTSQNVSDIVFPSSGVSYGKHVEPLFYRGCAFAYCHGQGSGAGGLNLESYQDLMNATPSVVYAKDTTNSSLVWNIEGTRGVQQRMPPPPLNSLNANQINGLKKWILEGAQNN